jgi:hypothetical protein
MSKRTWRKIVVDDVEYTWLMGKTTVVIRLDGVVVAKPQLPELTGESWHVIEHDSHKGNFHLTPKHVADWIGEKLL